MWSRWQAGAIGSRRIVTIRLLQLGVDWAPYMVQSQLYHNGVGELQALRCFHRGDGSRELLPHHVRAGEKQLARIRTHEQVEEETLLVRVTEAILAVVGGDLEAEVDDSDCQGDGGERGFEILHRVSPLGCLGT